MNYLLFLTAFLSSVSAVYTLTQDTTYYISYKARLVARDGKTCTGIGKVAIKINGKIESYGKELTPGNKEDLGKEEDYHVFGYKTPMGVSDYTIEREFRYKSDDSANWSRTSVNCQIEYLEQDIKSMYENCPILKENEKGLEEAVTARAQKCARSCIAGAIVAGAAVAATGGQAAIVLLLPMGPMSTIAGVGCATTCLKTACKKGVVGEECIAFGKKCSKDGLRCCDNISGNARTCKERSVIGGYRCRNP